VAATPTVLQRFGAAVRQYRQARGFTQHDLAAHTGLHYSYIGDVERGNRNVTLQTLLRLAQGLGVRPAQLLECFDTLSGQEGVESPPDPA
jgi:transcriptional regulator with XRE-family HTH domain